MFIFLVLPLSLTRPVAAVLLAPAVPLAAASALVVVVGLGAVCPRPLLGATASSGTTGRPSAGVAPEEAARVARQISLPRQAMFGRVADLPLSAAAPRKPGRAPTPEARIAAGPRAGTAYGGASPRSRAQVRRAARPVAIAATALGVARRGRATGEAPAGAAGATKGAAASAADVHALPTGAPPLSVAKAIARPDAPCPPLRGMAFPIERPPIAASRPLRAVTARVEAR